MLDAKISTRYKKAIYHMRLRDAILLKVKWFLEIHPGKNHDFFSNGFFVIWNLNITKFKDKKHVVHFKIYLFAYLRYFCWLTKINEWCFFFNLREIKKIKKK